MHKKLRVVADDAIPYLREFLPESQVEIIFKKGREVTPADVHDADALLVRTITPVNEALLGCSSVRFVGSCTAGVDHVDQAWLSSKGIEFALAAGANRPAVVDYVFCGIAYLREQQLLPRNTLKVGIIGVGRIGSGVKQALEQLGANIICYDPLRADQEVDFVSTPLNEFRDLDFITVHTPLTRTGPYPTFHMLDAAFLQQQKKGCVVLNAGRGAVIATDAWFSAPHVYAWLDVWEHEPHISLSLLEHVVLGTPHVAGYSQQSKWRATAQICQTLLRSFGRSIEDIKTPMTMGQPERIDIQQLGWEKKVLAHFDLSHETQRMQAALRGKSVHDIPDIFEALRRHYLQRMEFLWNE